MRIAATLEADGRVVTGLAESSQMMIYDTVTAESVQIESPAQRVESGRRLAVIGALLSHDVDIVYAIPSGFCTTSYALAQAAGMRFIQIEPSTPLQLLIGHTEALVTTAQAELPGSWLAEPAVVTVAQDRQPVLDDVATAALLKRLRRVEGQVRGVQRLLEEGSEIDQVLTQISAARSALSAVGMALLVEQLAACLAGGTGLAEQQRIAAAKQAFQRLN